MPGAGAAADPDGSDDAFYDALVEDDPDELYNNAPCGYVSTLADGTFVKVNATFLRWSGFRREELIGRRRFQELLAPGDRIFYETHFAPLLRMQGQVREIAVEVVCAGGERLPVLLNSVFKQDSGSRAFIRTAIFDATERRSYERELLAARRRAEESEARAVAVARTLQSTFLPPENVSVPGLDVAGAYRPAGDGSIVGGDFYDVFEIRPGTWGVVLGDVCGKGPSAAVVTSLARYSVRAEAVRHDRPSEVLSRLHKALLRNYPERFCTALYMVVRPLDEGASVSLSSGGHHLPIRRRSGNGLEVLGTTGSLLGMIDSPDLVDADAHLMPGDLVVMFTDGVTEARRDGELFGETRLGAVIEAVAASRAAAIAETIVSSVLDFQRGDARDDIAVVVIKAPEVRTAAPTTQVAADRHSIDS